MGLFYGFVFFAIKRTRCSSLIQPKTRVPTVPKAKYTVIQRFREIKHEFFFCAKLDMATGLYFVHHRECLSVK